jgi:hypothetical protein
MLHDKTLTYEQAQDFFDLGAISTIRLTRQAAIDVCRECNRRGWLAGRIEGGFHHPPHFFEARLDGIWDGLDPPASPAQIEQNNAAACDFIRQLPAAFSIFLVTVLGDGG